MNQPAPQIIGISGTIASGKDTLAHYLTEKYNYLHVSTSDIVRKEAMQRFGSIERPILKKTANFLRDTEGAGVFIQRSLDQWHASSGHQGVVITGIRTKGELKLLKNSGGVMVFVDAPQKLRYQRVASRQRDSEAALSFDDFAARDAAEMHPAESDADHNLPALQQQADLQLQNTGALDDFLRDAVARLHIQ